MSSFNCAIKTQRFTKPALRKIRYPDVLMAKDFFETTSYQNQLQCTLNQVLNNDLLNFNLLAVGLCFCFFRQIHF